MAVYCIDTRPAAGVPGDIHDTAQNTLLAKRLFSDGNTYIYLKGVASAIAGSWVAYDELAVTAGLDTDVAATIVSAVAIASGAIVANKFGWFGVDGSFSAGAAATVADNAKVFATSTVFICDDASVAGSQIVPAVWRSVDTTGLATVEIHFPYCGINVA